MVFYSLHYLPVLECETQSLDRASPLADHSHKSICED